MKKIILCILDGFGMSEKVYGNAIAQANKPNFDKLWDTYPHSTLVASGELVGLPKGQMGNSEVGHLNIGTGRIVDQPLQLISKKIKDKTLFKNTELLDVMNHVKENNSKLHILGLLSDGGVHSHIDHILGLLKMAKINNIEKVYFHVFLDGRDTFKDCAYKYVKTLEKEIKKLKLGKIATVAGRFYAMDRDKRWDRVELAYKAMVFGEGDHSRNIKELIENSYKKEEYDEFVEPTVINAEGIIDENDGIIFANFRPDRATEILMAISNPNFKEFKVKKLNNIKLVTMLPCSDLVVSKPALVEPKIEQTLGEYIASLDMSQLRIAETEKYAHVTYFFDGGEEKILKRERRVLVPSDRDVLTYDMKPEMSAYLITDKLLPELEKNYNLVILNYANCDMVGHTGNMKATIKAVEVVDECLGKLYDKAIELEYTLLIIADHGNADYMLDKGQVITAHSNAKVPFIICNNEYTNIKNGKLGDVAPTILKIMNVEIPKEMKGEVLIGK